MAANQSAKKRRNKKQFIATSKRSKWHKPNSEFKLNLFLFFSRSQEESQLRSLLSVIRERTTSQLPCRKRRIIIIIIINYLVYVPWVSESNLKVLTIKWLWRCEFLSCFVLPQRLFFFIFTLSGRSENKSVKQNIQACRGGIHKSPHTFSFSHSRRQLLGYSRVLPKCSVL